MGRARGIVGVGSCPFTLHTRGVLPKTRKRPTFCYPRMSSLSIRLHTQGSRSCGMLFPLSQQDYGICIFVTDKGDGLLPMRSIVDMFISTRPTEEYVEMYCLYQAYRRLRSERAFVVGLHETSIDGKTTFRIGELFTIVSQLSNNFAKEPVY